MKYLLALWLMVGCAWAQITPAMMQNYQIAASVADSGSSYLTDRTYLQVVGTSNNFPMVVSITGTNAFIDWGDGNSTNAASGASHTNTYATAGAYVITLRGGFTTFSLANAWTRSKLTRIITPLFGMTNLNSLEGTFANCVSLTGSIPNININSNLTTLSSTFSGCTALSGNYPSIANLYKLTTTQSAFYNCIGLLNNTSTLAYIWGSGSRSNLTKASQMFWTPNGTKTNLLGNASDFIALAKSASFTTNIYSTNGSYLMFYNQTNLSDYTTIDAAWK